MRLGDQPLQGGEHRVDAWVYRIGIRLAAADDTLPAEDEACSCAPTLPIAIHAVAAGDPTARLEICQQREAELYPGPLRQENPVSSPPDTRS